MLRDIFFSPLSCILCACMSLCCFGFLGGGSVEFVFCGSNVSADGVHRGSNLDSDSDWVSLC